jgi:hypothetical protein
MAIEKIIDITVNSNFDKTEAELKKLTNAIKQTDQEATNLDATFEEIYGDLQPLTARMGEAEDRLYELAKAGKQNTQEYKDLLRSVAEYKKVQQQTDLVVDAASQTMGSKLSGSLNAAAGGFALVQGSMALVGVESKEVEETLLKVNAAMAISQGVETINQGAKSVTALSNTLKSFTIVQRISTAVQVAYNAVMAANPIGAVVVAITALIAAGYALVKMFQASSDAAAKSEQAHKSLTKELKTQVEAQKAASIEADLSRDAQLKMAKASGQSAAEIRKLSVELANQEVAQKIANAQTLRAIAIEAIRVAGLEDATDAQKELAKNALKEFNDANELAKTAVLNRRKLLIDNKAAETQEQTDATKKANDKATEISIKNAADLKERLKKEREELLKLQQDYAQKERDLQKELGYKAQDDIEAAKKANADRLLTEEQLAIQNENDAYKLKYDNAVKAGQDTEELEIQHLNNLNDINLTAQEKTYAQQKEAADKEIALDKAVADQKKAIQDSQLNLASSAVGFLSAVAGKNKSLQKTAIIAESAIGIAKMIIANQTANIGALATPQAIATSGAAAAPVIAFNTITTALGVATTIAATAKALSAVGGGGAGGAPSGGGATGGGGAAPQFNVVGNSGVNQLADVMNTKEQTPVKAYVVPSDVTTGQSLDRNIIRNASLG